MSLTYFKRTSESIETTTFTLVDSDFGKIEIEISNLSLQSADQGFPPTGEAAIIKAYTERNLPVGKNIALAIIKEHERDKFRGIKEFVKWENEICPKYFSNWTQYAKERDEYLEKLLPLL